MHHILFLHSAKHKIVIFVASSARASIEIVFVGSRLAAVLHLDILAATSEFAPGEAFGLTAGEAVEKSGRGEGSGLVTVLFGNRWYGRRISRDANEIASSAASEAAAKKLNSSSQVTVFLASASRTQ